MPTQPVFSNFLVVSHERKSTFQNNCSGPLMRLTQSLSQGELMTTLSSMPIQPVFSNFLVVNHERKLLFRITVQDL
jgi:hypothetical protein